MRKLTKEQINIILTISVETGSRADLSDADLSHMDLSEIDFNGADLSGSILIDADLSDANLQNANLCGVDMRGAFLCRTNLKGTIMHDVLARCAHFYDANLYGADLRRADLAFASIRDSDLSYAIFDSNTVIYEAIIENVRLNNDKGLVSACPIVCPEAGSFVGWKKAKLICKTPEAYNGFYELDSVIVKLRILEDAKRSSATSRKCRCSAAMVEEIQTLDGKHIIPDSSTIVRSFHDPEFIYETGKIVSVSDFDDNRWNECSTGIHFFITREEAVNY